MFGFRSASPGDAESAGEDSPAHAVKETAGYLPYHAQAVRSISSHDALPAPLGLVPLGDADRILLTPANLPRLRNQIASAARLLGWYGEPLDRLLDAADAVASDALAQGAGGEVQLRATPDGDTLQVWVQSPGSAADVAPGLRATLGACDQVTRFEGDGGATWVIVQSDPNRAR